MSVSSHTSGRVLPLKCNHCFASLDADAQFDGRANIALAGGFFLDDTRHLSRLEWELPGFRNIAGEDGSTGAVRHLGRFRDHGQELRARRTLTLRPDGFDDEVEIVNEDAQPHETRVRLHAEADFRDVFELRGRERRTIGRDEPVREGWQWRYRAQDGVLASTVIAFDGWSGDETITLQTGERRVLRVSARFASDAAGPQPTAPQAGWTSGAVASREAAARHVRRAYDDVEMLLLSSPDGPQIAAGVPNFVTLFGRDALLSAWFLLDAAPDLAAAALRGLGRYQGTKDDPVTSEAPGKIPHEVRFGEMSRTGDVPFGRYYGTADASALYVILARDHLHRSGDASVVRELTPNWRGALGWCRRERGTDGFLRYPAAPNGRGLRNNSWKDSDDSMSDSSGALAGGRLAVVEVQGYLAAALEAGAELEEAIDGDPGSLHDEATALREAVDAAFWCDPIGLHALAVMEDGRQCDVASSNPGHLLWAGALSEARALQVAERLMRDDIWSGWGLRTLATGEHRFRPLSYHNGSVWPHDTGLFAAGLARYGMWDACRTVTNALTDLAATLHDHRLPELVGGYTRGELPPLPYIETCNPQAWAAAALVGAQSGYGYGASERVIANAG